MNEVEDLLEMASVADVAGKHERPVACAPVADRIDEAECAEDLVQCVQLSMHVADDTDSFRAVAHELRDVAMRRQTPFDGHVDYADVLHLEDVKSKIGRASCR